MKIKSFNLFQEKKSEKWIQDAIQKPGALRKEMGKKEGEKITSKEINQELDKLKKKDKDPSKKGVQGLKGNDLKKYRQLNLAKTLKGLKESHDETQNYMFFSNLEHICRMVTEINEMPQDQVDSMLTEHDWASDHMSRSFESISHVYNFLKAMMNGEEYEIPQLDSEPKINELKLSSYAKLKNKTYDYPWIKFLGDKGKADQFEKINKSSTELFKREFYKKYPIGMEISFGNEIYKFIGIKFNTNYTNYNIHFKIKIDNDNAWEPIVHIAYNKSTGYYIQDNQLKKDLDEKSKNIVIDMLKYNDFGTY